MRRVLEVTKSSLLRVKAKMSSAKAGPLWVWAKVSGLRTAGRKGSVDAREFPEDLPNSYGETRVALLPVDPYLVHVYWEITKNDVERAKSQLGKAYAGARPVLRFYDITYLIFDGNTPHHTFDVEIDLRTRNWYVPLWSPEKTYVIDIGFKTTEGLFYSLARSNVAQTSRAWPRPTTEKGVFLPEQRERISIPPEEQIAHGQVQNRPVHVSDQNQDQIMLPFMDSAQIVRINPDPLYRQRISSPYPSHLNPGASLKPEIDLIERIERQFVSGLSSKGGEGEAR